MGTTILIRSAWATGAALSLLGFARLAWAGPLDTSVVDKDATWMFHMNVEAGVASTCGRFATDGMAEDKDMQQAIKKFGLDPTKEIKGFTVYGFKPGEDDGVAVLVTTTAVDGLESKLAAAGLEGFESHKADGATISTWKSDGHTWHMAVRPTAKGDERLVLLASTQNALDSGLAVVAGTRPSVKALDADGPGAAMLVKPSAHSIVFIAARGLGDGPKFKTSLIKEAKSLFIDIGEEPVDSGVKETYAKASISAKDGPTAINMQQMIQGMIGMASMAAHNNKDTKGFADALQGVKVAADGSSVLISARAKSGDILQQLKDFGAAIKAGEDGTMSVSLRKDSAEADDKKAADKKEDGKKPPEKKD